MFKRNKKDNKGFTLVELVIVIAILAILVGLLAPQYTKYVEKSRKAADASNMDEMVKVVKVLAADPASELPAAVYTIQISNTAGDTATSVDSDEKTTGKPGKAAIEKALDESIPNWKSTNTNLSSQNTPITASTTVPSTETTNHAGIWNTVHPVPFSRNAVSTCHKKHINTTSSVALISFMHCLCCSSFVSFIIIIYPLIFHKYIEQCSLYHADQFFHSCPDSHPNPVHIQTLYYCLHKKTGAQTFRPYTSYL